MSMFRYKQTFRATPLPFLILYICVQHVLIPLSPPCGERGWCYLSSTHGTADRTSFTDNRRTGGGAFSLPCCIFIPVWIFVCVCVCIGQGIQGSYVLSINYSYAGEIACGSCLQDGISCVQWDRTNPEPLWRYWIQIWSAQLKEYSV